MAKLPQWLWNLTQLAVLVLPLFPTLGVVGLAIVLGAIWKLEYRRLIRYPLNWGLGLLSLWLIFSAAFAAHHIDAWLGLANFLPFFALFCALSLILATVAQLRQLAWLIVIPSLAIALLGLGQLFWGWSAPDAIARLVGWELVEGGNPTGRMSSAFMYANILAAYFLVVFILCLGLAIDTYRSWRRGLSQPFAWQWSILSLGIVGNGIGLILTSSRNAWAIALLACLAFGVYLGWRWLIVAVPIALSPIAWASWGPSPGRDWFRRFVPAYLWGRLSDEMYPDRPLATLRTTQWQFTWEMTRQHPWLGWGLRNFTPLYKGEMGIWLGHPHSLFLMLMAEIGLPGIILFCGLVAWVIGQAIALLKHWSSIPKTTESSAISPDNAHLILFTYLLAFSSCVLFNLFDVTVFDLRVNTLGWLILSAIGGIVYRSFQSDER